MEPFATVDDLEARWRPLSETEASRAEVLLAAASRRVRALAPGIDGRIQEGQLDPELVTDVVCEMVKRAMVSPVDQPSLESIQQSGGPFSQTLRYTSPTGDLYLTKAEKVLLGAGAQRAFMVDMAPPAAGAEYSL